MSAAPPRTDAVPGWKTQWFEPACLSTLALAVVAALWLSYPPSPIAFNDDFGYFRSIAATLQHGRPWTDEWLQPWAASLSALSGLIFTVTGNFRVATYGLNAVLTGAMVVFAVKLLRRQDVSLLAASLWVLVFLSFPTMLWKLAEFSAVPLYLTCLLAALWFAGRRQWGLFGVCCLIAFSSRQSALVWLALPAGALLEAYPATRAEWAKTLAK